ncbi:hypothetical protein LTR94_025033 [Friedmanniomyces endolithicus]|nr:hypothetical protein LTR94_025033 [Friedmanniomyces endolithicus]
MTNENSPILVFGATGQQGGSVANALIEAGWPVRALVRDPGSARAIALGETGVEILQGGFGDLDRIRDAMDSAHGVFSVQPSSPGGVISDADEVRYGVTVADLAAEAGVQHLVYSSTAAIGDEPSGVGHFDSKAEIEAHIRTLPVPYTIVRPASFMEMLMMPGFGLDESRFNFFMRPDQTMQFIAVADIGKIVAEVFSNPAPFIGETFDIASDSVSGHDLEQMFTKAAGRPIPYSRFSDAVLEAAPFLAKLMKEMDAGRLSGRADLETMRRLNPELQTFSAWLSSDGSAAFQAALKTEGSWAYARS